MQYVVQTGDTLFLIAQRFNTTAAAIARANNISDTGVIYVGQVLTIPGTISPVPVPAPAPEPPVSSSAAGGDCPLLRRGDRGADVRRLQTLLSNRGMNPGGIDGIFGSATETAVRTWQVRSNITVTGTSTIQTWRSLGVNCPVTPAPGPTPTPPPGGDCPLLRRGDTGTDVRRLQSLLRSRGVFSGQVNGIFGQSTEAAVRTWQRRQSLTITGTSTVQTWRSLGVNCSVTPGPTPPPRPPSPPPPSPGSPEQCFCPVLRRGSTGPSVRLLQRELQSRRYYSGPLDGRFDTRTENTVRQFQRAQGLAVTGAVNRATWQALGHDCCDAPSPSPGIPVDVKVVRGLRHVLQANRAVYRRGESVRLTLSKTNITSEPITLRYPTNQIIEITVRNASGRIIWRYSEHRRFGQGSRVITIFEGGTQNINEIWNQTNNNGSQVTPGNYTITMENLGTRASLTVPIRIQ